jgi:hypothetical protein
MITESGTYICIFCAREDTCVRLPKRKCISMMNNIGYKAYVQERFSLNKSRMEITEGGEKNE